MQEYTEFVLLPSLYAYLAKHAPNIQLEIKHVPLFGEKAVLSKHEVEFVIGLMDKRYMAEELHYEKLFSEQVVCVGSNKNPLLKKALTLKKYLTARHATYAANEENTPFIVDDALAELGHKRNIVLRLNHVVPVLYTIAQTDLIATVPRGVAKEAMRVLKLSQQKCPFQVPMVNFVILWKSLNHHDPACQWIKDVIIKLASEIKK